MLCFCSDDILQGPIEELSLGSDDDDDDEPQLLLSKHKKSKQYAKPAKIVPTGSDMSSSDYSDSEGDDDGPTTMANMEARSRALDAKAALEADLDAEEMQFAAVGDQDDDDEEDVDMQGEIDDDGEVFQLPTAEEREEEKKAGGPEVHVVQRRMRECVRVLGNFKNMAAKGRSAFTQTGRV
jgi:ribosomal RNA methyltransferase Nop2